MVLSSEESAAMKGGKGFSVITQRRPLKFIDTVISHAGAALVAWPPPHRAVCDPTRITCTSFWGNSHRPGSRKS
jgi:hypothetical protein